MIFFVPGYDPQTRANLAIAQRLVPRDPEGDTRLFDSAAQRAALVNALSTRASPIFAMSHGRQDRLLAQGGKPAIEESDTPLLSLLVGQSVFAYACHTATRLGRVASEHGATWWGYTGKVQCPVDTPPFDRIFVELFQLVLEHFWTSASHDARSAFLDEFKSRCDLAAREIDEIGDEYPDVDTFSAQLCALHVWDRLRIWVKGADGPEQHPEARPPTLIL